MAITSVAGHQRVPRGPHLEVTLIAIATMGIVPALVLSGYFLWAGPLPTELRWTLLLFVFGSWLASMSIMRQALGRSMLQISSLLSALREGDYSLRGVNLQRNAPLASVVREINELGSTLHTQRSEALESAALLSQVMEDVTIAVFAFDPDKRLVLLNRAAEKLLRAPRADLLGQPASQMGLDQCLAGEPRRVMDRAFGDRSRRYELHRSTFYRHGRPHLLLVMTDVSQALREEELAAWQRIVRVLSHEVNNSVAPIKSLANSLQTILDKLPTTGNPEDIRRGLSIIETRAGALGRFLRTYAQLASLPRPRFKTLPLHETVSRVAALETRSMVSISGPRDLDVHADPDQIEHLLINLVRNAVDASLETGGGIDVHWHAAGEWIEIRIDDEGKGLPDHSNLFVPFFTTKSGGSGIGLVLSRQIAEAHGGTLTLENRPPAGCRATLRLPVRRMPPDGPRPDPRRQWNTA